MFFRSPCARNAPDRGLQIGFYADVRPLAGLSPLGIVSAPLWDSKTSTFAGLLTTSDYINVIQYYFQNPAALDQIDQFRLDSLRGMLSCDMVGIYALKKQGLTRFATI